MIDIRGKRDLLSGRVPFFLGRRAQRIAPAHIANGFLRAGFGKGKNSEVLADLVLPDTPIPAVAGISSALRDDKIRAATFKSLAATLLNTDNRVFGGRFSSPFPLTLDAVTDDPSDDGFGRDLWDLVSSSCPEFLGPLAAKLSSSSSPVADVSGNFVAAIVGAQGTLPIPGRPTRTPFPWTRGSGSLARDFGASLARLVLQPATSKNVIRSWRVAQFARAAYFAAFLGSLRSVAIIALRPSRWSDLSPMVMFAGVPPGDAHDPAVRLAMASFQAMCREVKTSTRSLLEISLKSAQVPTRIPKTQRARVLVASAFPDLKPELRLELAAFIAPDLTHADSAQKLSTKLYPDGFLEKTYRAMGHKLGLAGPERGSGTRRPRFCLETPALALLISVTVEANDSMPLRNWIERVYERYGVILGACDSTLSHLLSAKLLPPASLRSALELNTRALETRLVRAGLAIEVSDGETEVLSNAHE